MAIPRARRADPPLAQHRAIEDQKGIGSRHGLYVRRKRGGR
jgi:hypothetical protein